MAGAYTRGAHTMNSMFVKPLMRKSYHKKNSSDIIRETVKLDAEEVKNKSRVGDNDGNCWIPHDQTGIYYPKGQEKVMENVPKGAGKDVGINWFSYKEDNCV